jgi:hypothetical protein
MTAVRICGVSIVLAAGGWTNAAEITVLPAN